MADLYREAACIGGMAVGLLVDWPQLALFNELCGSGTLELHVSMHVSLLPHAHLGMLLGAIAASVRAGLGHGWPELSMTVVRTVVMVVLNYAGMLAGSWAVMRIPGFPPELSGYVALCGMILGMGVVAVALYFADRCYQRLQTGRPVIRLAAKHCP